MIYRSDDPIADYMRHDAEQARELKRLPVCADCGQPVQDDHFFLIVDEVICPDCLEAGYRREIEDYIE